MIYGHHGDGIDTVDFKEGCNGLQETSWFNGSQLLVTGYLLKSFVLHRLLPNPLFMTDQINGLHSRKRVGKSERLGVKKIDIPLFLLKRGRSKNEILVCPVTYTDT